MSGTGCASVSTRCIRSRKPRRLDQISVSWRFVTEASRSYPWFAGEIDRSLMLSDEPSPVTTISPDFLRFFRNLPLPQIVDANFGASVDIAVARYERGTAPAGFLAERVLIRVAI